MTNSFCYLTIEFSLSQKSAKTTNPLSLAKPFFCTNPHQLYYLCPPTIPLQLSQLSAKLNERLQDITKQESASLEECQKCRCAQLHGICRPDSAFLDDGLEQWCTLLYKMLGPQPNLLEDRIEQRYAPVNKVINKVSVTYPSLLEETAENKCATCCDCKRKSTHKTHTTLE